MFLVGSKICAIYKEKTGLEPPSEVHDCLLCTHLSVPTIFGTGRRVHIVVLRTHKHIQITFIFFFFFLLSLVMCVHKASLTHTSHHTFEIVYVCVDASSLVRSAPPSSPRRQRNAAFIKHL